MPAVHELEFRSERNLTKSKANLTNEMRTIIENSSHEELQLSSSVATSNTITFIFSENDLLVSRISDSTIVQFANLFSTMGSYFEQVYYTYTKNGFFSSNTYTYLISTGIRPPVQPPTSTPPLPVPPGPAPPPTSQPPPTITLPPNQGSTPVLPPLPLRPVKNHEIRISTLLAVSDSILQVIRRNLAPFVDARLGSKYEISEVQKTGSNELTIRITEFGNNLLPLAFLLPFLAKIAVTALLIITGWTYKENRILQGTVKYQQTTLDEVDKILRDKTLTNDDKEKQLQALLSSRGNPTRVLQEGNGGGGLFDGAGTAAVLLIGALLLFSKK